MDTTTQHLLLGMVAALLGVIQAIYQRSTDRALVDMEKRLKECWEETQELRQIISGAHYD